MARLRPVRHQFEGLGQEGVTCKNAHCLSKHLMTGQLPPAIVIIIHGGEVIVYKGVGMDHLQGTGKRKNSVSLSSGCLKGCHGQDGANPFSSRKKAITNGAVERSRKLHLFWKISLKGFIQNYFFLPEIASNIQSILPHP